MKLRTTDKAFGTTDPKYARVILTETKSTKIVETAKGITELRIGAGKFADTDERQFRTLVRKIVGAAKDAAAQRVAVELSPAAFPKLTAHGDAWFYSTVAENLLLAAYEFTRYKTPAKSAKKLDEVLLCGALSKEGKAGIARGTIVSEAANEIRDLANTPGGDMTPALLAESAQRILKGTQAKVTVLDKKAIEKLNMGAILGVSKGSPEEPRFIVIEYYGGAKKEQPLVYVGKGITFDTGGLNLKPSDGILDMHLDMSGGAAVIGALAALARLGVERNVIGLIPAAENSVSGTSYRPGDVLRTMSGKTVDVLNTDAEGRLVLADALTYAKKYDPALVVDVATLTGAALVALGNHASAVMTKDDALAGELVALGEASGDLVWPLPLWDEYKQYTKGVHGDIANIPSSNARSAGAINGGMFLSHFADGYPWAHIDIAPRMVAASGDHLAKGATGEPVRLLVKIAENRDLLR